MGPCFITSCCFKLLAHMLCVHWENSSSLPLSHQGHPHTGGQRSTFHLESICSRNQVLAYKIKSVTCSRVTSLCTATYLPTDILMRLTITEFNKTDSVSAAVRQNSKSLLVTDITLHTNMDMLTYTAKSLSHPER